MSLASVGGEDSYIESIVQENGVVTAVAKTLPTYSLTTGSTIGAVEFNGSAVSVSGWSTLTGSVEANTLAINGVDARV